MTLFEDFFFDNFGVYSYMRHLRADPYLIIMINYLKTIARYLNILRSLILKLPAF